jgi:hypothetical protein
MYMARAAHEMRMVRAQTTIIAMKLARETTKSPGRRFMQTLVSSEAAVRATKLSIELGSAKG